MKFNVLTLFPEMFSIMNESIIGRAIENNKIEINAVNIRDFADNKHNRVDDYPYGGGAGMVMMAPPIFRAYNSLNVDKSVPVIYMSPQGKPFTQDMAREYAKYDELVILCGHYEGVDERILEEIVTDEVSIGDYVLTGGELPAMVVIDTISRLVDDVIAKESIEEESFSSNLLEYPQYTRPEEFNGKKVPEVLLSGHHENIKKWREEEAVKRTKLKRPDLLS
ncbi:MAG: tRNA (guanosine(37)-N1)-methyltransferase TrmD [Clostridia bacterium]|nr:tRNA (guanosine(37)-N1)-methyltransferase TrmD [Clostridia bacterium]